MWMALFWGAFSSASLYVGQALAKPLGHRTRAVGLLMGFGAGTLLSAVAYQLVPQESLRHGIAPVLGFVGGAAAYYLGDLLIDSRGGEHRQRIKPSSQQAGEGSGAAMFLGALLDGIPEAFILGLTLALGGSLSLAFLAAIFVSNVPQGLAGTTSLEASGTTQQRIFWMWTGLTAACGVASLLGNALAGHLTGIAAPAEAFAGGAVLMMLADSMTPEAHQHGGRAVGLFTVAGFLVAGALSVVQ